MEVSSPEEITSADFALFKDALSGEECNNVEVKIYAVKRIASLAKALGPQRTREELVDILAAQIDNLEDEVLFHLSEELEQFLPLVGGPDCSYELLSILLKISRSVDETLVRNRAIEAIKKLLTDIDQQLTEKYLVSSIINIDDNVWFSEKCSTLALIPVCYPKANPEHKIVLRQKYCQLSDDNSALIRKLAAAGLPDFIDLLEIEHVLKDFLPMLNQITEDDQDCVKINAAEIGLSVARKSRNQEVRNDMLQIIQKLSRDESWRIRQKVALLIDRIVETFEDAEFVPTLFDMYENLINDDNTEVRVYAAQNMYNFIKNLFENFMNIKEPKQKFEEIFLEKCMPILMSLTTDNSDEVQIALSSKITLLSSIISDDCFKNNILPLIVNGLEKDKPLLFKENLLMNLDHLPKDIDLIESLSSINKIIQHILVTSENSWRTRRSLLITFVHVSRFCDEEFFKKNLFVYYITLLKDNVFAVRRTATLILPILAKRFGAKWLLNEMTPHLHVTLNEDKYLFRYIILFSIQELIYPSIESRKQDYLEGLRKLMETDEKKHRNTLLRIFRLIIRLQKSLEEKPFDSILKTYVDDNNIFGENVRLYSEEVLDTIMKNNINIFSIQKNKLDDEMCYLEGILILLNEEILNVVKVLSKDPIKNIQDRAKYVLLKIKEFSENLDKEIVSEWVVKYTNDVSETTWQEIDALITEQLHNVQSRCAQVEKIDINLKETITSKHWFPHTEEDFVEKLEVFPRDPVQSETINIDEMESVDEEKCKDSKS